MISFDVTNAAGDTVHTFGALDLAQRWVAANEAQQGPLAIYEVSILRRRMFTAPPRLVVVRK